MDIGKEIREVEFQPMDPVRETELPSVPAVPGQPVPREPAPDKEPAHAQ